MSEANGFLEGDFFIYLLPVTCLIDSFLIYTIFINSIFRIVIPSLENSAGKNVGPNDNWLRIDRNQRKSFTTVNVNPTILVVKLKMINQDRMIFGDFSVNFEPISLKFCKGHFLLKS